MTTASSRELPDACRRASAFTASRLRCLRRTHAHCVRLARYREFLEHNEFDSDRPGPRASRAQGFLVLRNPASARKPGSITGCWMRTRKYGVENLVDCRVTASDPSDACRQHNA